MEGFVVVANAQAGEAGLPSPLLLGCLYDVKVKRAQDAGAIGVVMQLKRDPDLVEATAGECRARLQASPKMLFFTFRSCATLERWQR